MIDLHTSTWKRYRRGTHRTRPPEETVADYGRHMAAMGITRLANVTGLDRLGLPVVVAVRPNARSLSTSQGKGETLAAAQASALMEAIEGWHAERIELPLICGSHRSMRARGAAVDPEKLPLSRGAKFLPERPLMWIEGFDIMQLRPCWVPFDMVSTNFVFQPGVLPLFNSGSNGLASGNTIAEAVLHGLCEVVERDALTLWELAGTTLHESTRVDLLTIADPHLRNLLDTLAAMNVVVAVWSLVHDVGLPTYKALVADDPEAVEWRRIRPMSGSGSHLSPEIALSRAVHEAIQSRLTMISGSRDDIVPAHFARQDAYGEDRVLLDALNVQPHQMAFGDVRPAVGNSFETDIATILDMLRSVDVASAIVVDLGRQEFGIPVVKVVVPELEGPLHRRFVPGRRARERRARIELAA